MRNLTPAARYSPASTRVAGQIAVLNRRLLIGAVTLLLWAATLLALQAMGPNARALMAGEGVLMQADQ